MTATNQVAAIMTVFMIVGTVAVLIFERLVILRRRR